MDQEMKFENLRDKPQSNPETSTALVQTSYIDLSTPPKASDDSLPSTPSRSETGSRGSSERGTPSKTRRESGGSVKLGENFDTASTCSSTSSTTKGRLPNRPGIRWKKNERVEAMDFMKKWYPAKIVDLDDEEEEVLIHFEGWNQRYDEWVPMTSEKLRPKMRHSERKERKKKLHSEYKAGEHVYAKWTDCKMYPGKIISILSDGSFEIVFYDGFKKIVQPINIRPMPQEAQKQKIEIVHVLPKEVRKRSESSEGAENRKYRSRRSSLPVEQRVRVNKEFEKSKNKPDTDVNIIDGTTGVVKTEPTNTMDKATSATINKQESSNQRTEITPTKYKKVVDSSGKKSEVKNSGEKTNNVKPEKSKLSTSKDSAGMAVPSRDKKRILPSKEKSRAISSKSRTALFPKNKKLIVAPSVFVKKEKKDSACSTAISIKEEHIDVDIIKEEPVASEQSETTSSTETQSTMTMTSFPVTLSPAVLSSSLNLKDTEDTKADQTPLINTIKGDNYLSASNTLDKQKKAKKRTVSPSASETSYSSESQSEDGSVARKRSRSTDKERGASYALVSGPPPKAFVIEQDHNQYKCMFDGCNKSFRKENLLSYHIKYYHTDNKPHVQLPQPPPKRRKTSSICSTDSDISQSSKQRSASGGAVMGMGLAPRKQRHVSADSVLITTTTQDLPSEVETPVAIPVQPPEATVVEVSNPVKQERTTPSQDTMITEEFMEMEDELSRDEVVNCVCGYNEENGLMIQCDVCLCWQHAACFDITTETLPTKYICFICENPPGVRDSCRYVHEQDWMKLGQPAKFSFLPTQEDESKCLTMQATNSLIADIHNINSVLHGLRQKIKHVKNKDHPEYHLWKRNWDTEDTISLQDDNDDKMSLQDEGVPYARPEDDYMSMDTNDASSISESVSKIDKTENINLTDDSNTHDESNTKSETEEPSMVSLLHTNMISKNLVSSSITKCESSTSLATESTLTAVDETSQFSLDAEPSSVGEDIQVETNSNSNMISFGNEGSQDENMSDKSNDRVVVQEDPYKDCERNLLEHILRVQSEIDSRLDFIDEQVILLESTESTRSNSQPQDILADLPALKKSLHILENDLIRVKRLSAYHR